MEPYIFLLGFIFIISFCAGIYPNPRTKDIFLFIIFIYIYVFCCIRSFDVGRDIPGYIQMYERTSSVLWNDWDYTYFENGYIALMKICNMVGLSARGFFFVIYFIILFPVYLLIKKRSPYPLISVIIYIGFQFFVFDLTGLRQAIGMSLCMLAYLVASENKGVKNLIYFILLVCAAASFHESALIFLFVYPIMRLPINRRMIVIYCIVAAVCYVLNIAGIRTVLSAFEKTHYEYSTDASQQLGFTLIAICLIAAIAVWTFFHTKKTKRIQIKYAANILLSAICILLLFNGSVLLRSAMYYYFPMIIAIPMYIGSVKNYNLRIIASICVIITFLAVFFTSSVHSFDVTPYTIGNDLCK